VIDSHVILSSSWGVLPYLKIGELQFETYNLMAALALVVALLFKFKFEKKESRKNGSEWVVLGGLVGGILGARLIELIFHGLFFGLSIGATGQSVVGGLIGGSVGSKLVKRYLGIKYRLGDILAPTVALGLAIGRIGCYLRGCCFGLETHTKFGVDFGDHLLRYPTQLFESGYLFILFILLWRRYQSDKILPYRGYLFDVFLVAYFSFRFVIDFIKYEPKVIGPLTVYQILSVLVISYVLFFNKRGRINYE